MKMLSLFCVIAFLLTLSGCGQTGPLYLPNAQASTQQPIQPIKENHAHQNT